MKPRASIPTTLSTFPRPYRTTIRSMADENAVVVGEQRRDVLEDDALLREVGHVADERAQALERVERDPLRSRFRVPGPSPVCSDQRRRRLGLPCGRFLRLREDDDGLG